MSLEIFIANTLFQQISKDDNIIKYKSHFI